jgi:hypothetical protein
MHLTDEILHSLMSLRDREEWAEEEMMAERMAVAQME